MAITIQGVKRKDRNTVETSAYPDATNTGHIAAGYTSLTSHAAGWHITSPGTYTGYDVPGNLYIEADNVTIQGFHVHGAVGDNLILVTGENAQILDCTIAGNGNSTAQAPETGWIECQADGMTVRRCNMYWSSGDGIRLAESSDITVEDNYLHDWVSSPTNDPHVDGIATGSGTASSATNANWLIKHNTILMWCAGHMSNVISLAVDLTAHIGPITVENNLIAGGGHTIHGGGNTQYSGIVFTGNKFSTQFSSAIGDYGIMTFPPTWGTNSSSWTGNTYYDGVNAGQTIAAP